MKTNFILSQLDHWMPQAEQHRQRLNPLRAPLDVTLREAVRAACFLKRRWAPQGDIPGMGSMKDLPLSLADEILSLVRAVQEALLLWWIEEESIPPEDPIEAHLGRARFLILELRRALAYLARGELPEKQARQIKKLNKLPEHAREDASSLLLLLRLYTEVSEALREQLATLGESFRVALIDEAKQQQTALEEQIKEGTEAAPRRQRVLYYQVLALLGERVGRVRAAAGFVYREHKKVLREVTSAYERTRRRNARKLAKERAIG